MAAYNEGKVIEEVIKKVQAEGYENIIVVDDCSKDNTKEIAEKNKAIVKRHSVNMGQGAALRTGINEALKLGADIIVTFDSDGQHDAKEIKDLIEPIKNNEVDIVLGTRFGKSKVPFFKKIVLKGGVVFTYLISGLWLTDTHNGFRAMSKDAASKIEITENRMEHASEILDEIAKKKIKYKEVPVTIIYTDYSMNKGQSIFNSINIAWNMIKRKLKWD